LASDYALPTTASGPGHITAVTLTASIIGDPTRPYNGTTTAVLTSTNFSLSGLIGLENFTVTQTSGTYNSKDVVSANTVTATLAAGDFTPTNGAVATNYVLPSTASGAGHITTATLTAAIVGDPTRPYNGNTNATLTSGNFSLSGLASGEGFAVTQTAGTYNSKDVVTANTVTASLSAAQFTAAAGTLVTNYVLPTTASGAGHITAVTVTASIIGNPTRQYNGNRNATLTSANFSLSGLIGMESFTVTQTSGTYNSKDVLTANTVTATLSATDFTAAMGTLASDYVLPTIASGPGQIIKTNATVVVTPYTNANTTYDGLSHTATVTSITGVNGETGATVGAINVSNTTHTNAGTYASDYWFFTGTSNYNDIGNTTITDSIKQAPLAIKADDKAIVLHAALPQFTVTPPGFVNGESFGVLGGTLTFTPTTTPANAGTYDIVPSGYTSNNYMITFQKGTLMVMYSTSCIISGDPTHTILQPINPDGSSVNKAGSTVPAKFRVADANCNSIGTPGVVTMFKLIGQSSDPNATINEDVTSTTPDTAFRWDPAAQQWIFNISTKGMKAGVKYTYQISLNDGSSIVFSFALR
jgi:MBG domain-containing protein/YDG domain-containing protein